VLNIVQLHCHSAFWLQEGGSVSWETVFIVHIHPLTSSKNAVHIFLLIFIIKIMGK